MAGDDDDGGSDDEVVWKTVPCSIKCAAKKLLVENENKAKILEQIKKNSIMCTRIARLASLLIHYVFNRIMDQDDQTVSDFFNVTDNNADKNSPTEQKIKDYFYAVVDGYQHSDEYPMSQHGNDFLRMMNQFNVPLGNNDYLDNTFKHMYQQYHVNLRTNIRYHAKKRVRKFLKHVKATQNPVPPNCRPAQRKQHLKQNEIAVNKTIGFLFHGSVEYDADLLREFENVTRPNTDNPCGLFDDLHTDWFKMLPIFFRIQRYAFAKINESEKQKKNKKKKKKQKKCQEKGFEVVPQTSFQRRHILIDTNALHALHARLGIVPMRTKTKKMTREDFTKKPQKVWPNVINYNEIKTLNGTNKCDKRFDHSILTDGVAMSLSCKKTIRVLSDEQRRKMIQKKLKDNLYKFIFGLDPGYRLTLGGVRRGAANAFERNVRLKWGKFYQCSHEFHRNKKKEKLYTNLQQKLVEDRKRYTHTPSSKRYILISFYQQHTHNMRE